jgi:hypothetical protein
VQKEDIMKKLFKALKRSEKGQALGEYSIMMTGLFMITIVMMITTGETLREPFCRIADELNWPACAELQPDWGLPEDPDPEEEEECHILQESEGGSECDQSGDCTLLPGVNSGEWDAPDDRPIRSFVIKAGKEYHIYQSGMTFDGCYNVWLGEDGGMPADAVRWERTGHGSGCQDISHMQSWFMPLCEPEG